MSHKTASFWLVLFVSALMAFPLVTVAGADCGEQGCGEQNCDDDGDGSCEDGLHFTTDIRWRGEIDGKDFNADTDMATFSLLRARMNFMYKFGDVSNFIQLQHSRTMGWASSGLAPANELDVHQAYFYVEDICGGLGLKVGRYEMNYGDQRLIGSVGWDNVGRVFDGITFGYKRDLFWADLFFTKQVERSDPESALGKEKDDLFFGLWGKFKPLNLNLFFLHNRNVGSITDGTGTTTAWKTNLSRSTLGMHHWMYYSQNLVVLFDFAYQMGKSYPTPGDEDTAVDIGAWMAVLGASYKLPLRFEAWVGAGFDMTSGDDPESEEYEGFSNLYYTGHKWRGYMDYFVEDDFLNGTNPGLTDIFINAFVKPPGEKCTILLEYHLFSTAQDYTMDNGETSTSIGSEINLVRTQQLKDNLGLEMGLGYFMPHEDWQGPDADGALWGYMQLTMKLGD